MDLQQLIPSKTFMLDDNADAIKIAAMLFEVEGVGPFKGFTNLTDLMEVMDGSGRIVIVDYHLESGKSGVDAAMRIKDKFPRTRFIFISSLLSGAEYEDIVNTCGCDGICRKEDPDKMLLLVKRAIENVNTEILQSMEIIIEGKSLLQKIDDYKWTKK